MAMFPDPPPTVPGLNAHRKVDPTGRDTKHRETIKWVLVAKGIGIVLVVMGHFTSQKAPIYWLQTVRFIYLFHMPLFFLLSGYLFHPGNHIYLMIIQRKARRLLYPFISISLFYVLIKIPVEQLFHLDNPVRISTVIALITDPLHSLMPLMWFLHALMIIFVIYPLLERLLGDRATLLLFLLVNLVLGSDYPVVGRAIQNMPYFIFGVVLAKSGIFDNPAAPLLAKRLVASATVPLLAAIIYAPVRHEPQFHVATNYLAGYSGSLFIIFLSQVITRLGSRRWVASLSRLGLHSVGIYLLHPLFESAVRLLFAQQQGLTGVPFEAVMVIAVMSGCIFPMLLEAYGLRRFLLTRKYILGLR